MKRFDWLMVGSVWVAVVTGLPKLIDLFWWLRR